MQMASKYLKKNSVSVAVREIQTTLRFQISPVRMDIIKKTSNFICSKWYAERGSLLNTKLRMWTRQPQCKSVLRFPKKLNTELPYDLTAPFLGCRSAHNSTIHSSWDRQPGWYPAMNECWRKGDVNTQQGLIRPWREWGPMRWFSGQRCFPLSLTTQAWFLKFTWQERTLLPQVNLWPSHMCHSTK